MNDNLVVLQFASQNDYLNPTASSGFLQPDDGTGNPSGTDFSFTIPSGTFPSTSNDKMIRIKLIGVIGITGASLNINVNGSDFDPIFSNSGEFSSEITFTYNVYSGILYTVKTISNDGSNPTLWIDNPSTSLFWGNDISIKFSFSGSGTVAVNDITIWQLTIETAYTV